MINKEEFHVFNYIKKEELTGSMEGMRYMLKKVSTEDGDRLQVNIWQGPLNFFKTPNEKKTVTEFPFSPEGVEMAVDWMNEQYAADKAKWEEGKKFF